MYFRRQIKNGNINLLLCVHHFQTSQFSSEHRDIVSSPQQCTHVAGGRNGTLKCHNNYDYLTSYDISRSHYLILLY